MASTEQLQEAERTMRALLEREGLPEPDEIEYGETCIRLFWHARKAVVIVSADQPAYWELDPGPEPGAGPQ
jgi:hypothetical protein